MDNSMQEEQLLALSWNIATEPQLYWQLAPNPYAGTSLQIISERFPTTQLFDIIRAVVLAEPEGRYDRNFRLLGFEQQTQELRNQRIVSREINKRLADYCTEHEEEFNWLPKRVVYDSMSRSAFGTDDLKEIELRYAQHQRRDVRLSIVNYIEARTYAQERVIAEKKIIRDRTFFVGVSAITFFITFISLIQLQIHSSTKHKDSTQILGTKAQKENKRFPERLKIPSINVDVAVQYMGITEDGAMAVPDNTKDVGWYRLGPSPGEKGSAVISGHFDGRAGESGVFNNLDKLKPGDKIYTRDDLGIITTFVVRESRMYNPGYAEEVFLPKDNGTHLNLITCDGNWNGAKKTYSKRLVVFADIAL